MRNQPWLLVVGWMACINFVQAQSSALEWDLQLDAGYRVDQLDWTIAGDITGANPNILSELNWDDLRIAEVRTKGSWSWPGGLQLQAGFGFGDIIKGDNQDADFNLDDRAGEFSRSNNANDGDEIWDAQVALGWKWEFIDHSVQRPYWFIPWVGYAYRAQNLRLTEGVQTIPNTGAFSGLDSTYESEWDGYWVGLEFWMQATDKSRLFMDFQYHWSDFYAQGQWNLRTTGAEALAQPKSYEQIADANGFVGRLGLLLQPFQQSPWQIKLQGELQKWRADEGMHRIFPATGGSSDTRLNEVKWRSATWSLGLLYPF